jgi:hypothetical protein
MSRGVIDYAHAVMLASSTTGRRRTVLLALALHADHRGHARPSVTTLAEWAGLDRRHTQTALRELQAAGELECVWRSPRGRPSEYRIVVDLDGNPTAPHTARSNGSATAPTTAQIRRRK